MVMKEELITFSTAKLAKEKRFNELGWNMMYNQDGIFDSPYKETYPAPSQNLLQRWLREVHNILVYVDPRSYHIFQYHIITEDDEIIGSSRLDDWEKTLEDGLYEALKLIK